MSQLNNNRACGTDQIPGELLFVLYLGKYDHQVVHPSKLLQEIDIETQNADDVDMML